MGKGKIVSQVTGKKISSDGSKGSAPVTWISYGKKNAGDPSTAVIGQCYPCYEKIPAKPTFDIQGGSKKGSCVSFDFNLIGNPGFLVATNVTKLKDSNCG